jgi:hypothetical protein
MVALRKIARFLSRIIPALSGVMGSEILLENIYVKCCKCQ